MVGAIEGSCTRPQDLVSKPRTSPEQKRRGSLRFLPPPEVRPSSVAPDPAESRGAYAQRLVWAAKQPLGNAALVAPFA